jgi:hypothetical protein
MIKDLFRQGNLSRLLQRVCIMCACSVLSVAAMAQGISPAEQLLFETNHMQSLQSPVTLTYSYQKEAVAETGFNDQVQIEVKKINPDKSVAVSTHFLSDERNLPIADLEQASGNPALLGFLERDIAEMKQHTGGSTNYFRKRIRMALANEQELHPVRFVYAGKERQGKEVRIQPYLNDPMHDHFPDYEHKSYVFVFSDDVPGGLYQIRSSFEGSTAQKQPGIVETLTLIKDDRLAKK